RFSASPPERKAPLPSAAAPRSARIRVASSRFTSFPMRVIQLQAPKYRGGSDPRTADSFPAERATFPRLRKRQRGGGGLRGPADTSARWQSCRPEATASGPRREERRQGRETPRGARNRCEGAKQCLLGGNARVSSRSLSLIARPRR